MLLNIIILKINMIIFNMNHIKYNHSKYNIEKYINPFFIDDLNDIDIIINKSLNYYLNIEKNYIERYQKKWDIYKKITYNFEYISSSNKLYKSTPICSLRPISRAFYKMIEICNRMNLLNELNYNIKSLHLAEAPGGFVEALSYLRDNKNDNYYGITLIDDIHKTPKWKSSNIISYDNFKIEYGSTKDGNLISNENLSYIYNKHKNSCHIITGDGGIDFTNNYSDQEKVMSKLIFSQIAFAISCQIKGGTFILKMFDIFTGITLDYIYLLNCLYKDVYIYKPFTSRIANSEKYIICKNFKLNDSENLFKIFNKILEKFKIKYIKRLFNFDLPLNFINDIENINSTIGKKQLDNIIYTINLIRKNETFIDENKNIKDCKNWCIMNNLPYNKCN
jgi:23S rRNA U2552 (ribose-2'-O)-methylase RlmE/FtsJ